MLSDVARDLRGCTAVEAGGTAAPAAGSRHWPAPARRSPPPLVARRFELKKSIPVALTLSNPTDQRVAFKVKTTAPKKYCVKPSNGFVEPGSTRDVQVVMQPQREYPASFAGEQAEAAWGQGFATELAGATWRCRQGRSLPAVQASLVHAAT